MFKPRDTYEPGHGGPVAFAATLTHAEILEQPSVPLRQRMGQWREALERLDIAPDLAEDIGSRRWLRGLATLIGLCTLAISLRPGFSVPVGAPYLALDAGAQDTLRSQMIMPLGLGADSGARMAPGSRVVPLAAAPERTDVQLVATLVAGDSFARMLQRAGVGEGDAARVTQLVAGQVPLTELEPGTRFAITLGPRPSVEAPRQLMSLDFRARFDLDLAVNRGAQGLGIQRKPLAVDATPLRIRGTVGASLYRSARAAGAPIKAIQQYLQTLDAHFGLEGEIRPEDTFDIIVGHKRSASGESETGELLFAGLEQGGKPRIQLLRWGKDGSFFEASGIGQPRASLYFPVAGRMTSGFGLRRHPILGYTRLHAGVDFGAPYGSPIYAVAGGTISFAGRHGGHGNYVRVDHGGAMASGYAHMSRIAVSPGMQVNAGQVIGYVGSSGLSTGPHLHYEVYQNGRTVNPLSVQFTVTPQIDQRELAAFKARVAELKAVRAGAALGNPVIAAGAQTTAMREIARVNDSL